MSVADLDLDSRSQSGSLISLPNSLGIHNEKLNSDHSFFQNVILASQYVKFMAVGTGGGGTIAPPPHILPTQKIQDCKKQRHIEQCIEIWLKYVNSSVDIGNHRYTNEQNCILFEKKVWLKKIFARPRKSFFAPPPQSQNRSYGLEVSNEEQLITGYPIGGAMGSSGGGRVRMLSMVCLHKNAIVARGIPGYYTALWDTRTPPQRHLYSSVGTSLDKWLQLLLPGPSFKLPKYLSLKSQTRKI